MSILWQFIEYIYLDTQQQKHNLATVTHILNPPMLSHFNVLYKGLSLKDSCCSFKTGSCCELYARVPWKIINWPAFGCLLQLKVLTYRGLNSSGCLKNSQFPYVCVQQLISFSRSRCVHSNSSFRGQTDCYQRQGLFCGGAPTAICLAPSLVWFHLQILGGGILFS